MADDRSKALVPRGAAPPAQAKPVWPPTEMMLQELLETAGTLHLHKYSALDTEPFEASVSSRGSYLSFRGRTPTGALRRLWLAVRRIQGEGG